MPFRVRAAFVVCLLAASTLALPASTRKISIMPADHEGILREEGFEVWTRQADFVIGTAGDATIDRLAGRGMSPIAEYDDLGQWMYLLHHRPGFIAPAAGGATIHTLTPEIDLYLFPESAKVELPRVKPYGGFQAIPRVPLPPKVTHPADLAASSSQSPTAANPLVSQILAATSQTSWYQMVKDLSGENPVTIGGQPWTISTRYSASMFPTPAANAHATEYLEDRGAQWGYTGKREAYTSAESGCSQGTWQNLIFVVPGPVCRSRWRSRGSTCS